MGYVYLLQHKSEPRFKIGKADNLRVRANALGGADSFDFERSVAFKTARAPNLERALHHIFAEARLSLDTKQDGYTEWFDNSILNDVVKFVQSQTDVLGVDEIETSLSRYFTNVRGVTGSTESFILIDISNQIDLYFSALEHYLRTGQIVGRTKLEGDEGFLYFVDKGIPLLIETMPQGTSVISDVDITLYKIGQFYVRSVDKKQSVSAQLHGNSRSTKIGFDQVGAITYQIPNISQIFSYGVCRCSYLEQFARISEFYSARIPLIKKEVVLKASEAKPSFEMV